VNTHRIKTLSSGQYQAHSQQQTMNANRKAATTKKLENLFNDTQLYLQDKLTNDFSQQFYIGAHAKKNAAVE